MREDARFIIWAHSGDGYSDGMTVDSNKGKGYEINDARVKADTFIKGKLVPTGFKVYLLRMEHQYIPEQVIPAQWKAVG
jgi:hypothetical protein